MNMTIQIINQSAVVQMISDMATALAHGEDVIIEFEDVDGHNGERVNIRINDMALAATGYVDTEDDAS